MDELELATEIRKRYEVVEKTLAMNFDQLNHSEKLPSSYVDQETLMKDNEEFEKLRIDFQEDIIQINKKIKQIKDIKFIKKAAKNMFETSNVSGFSSYSGETLIG